MAKADLKIQLERPDSTYTAGESIAGRVSLTATSQIELRGIWVTVAWQAGERPFHDFDSPEGINVLPAPRILETGQTVDLPFSLRIPDEPASYAGAITSIRWYATSTADIAGVRDVTGEVQFTVLPSPKNFPSKGQTPYFDSLIAGAQRERVREPWGRGLVNVFFLPIQLLGALLLVVTLAAVIGLIEIENDATGFKSLAVAVVWNAIMFAFYKRFGGGKTPTGSMMLSIKPQTLRAGNTVQCTVGFFARKKAEIIEARLHAVACEEIHYGPLAPGAERAKGLVVKEHIVFEESVLLTDAPRTIGKKEKKFVEHELRIPAHAAPSFRYQFNRLQWKVVATAKTARGEEWRIEDVLTVK